MSRAFIPAAGHDFFLPLYDPLWRLLGGERVRATFIREAGLAAPQRILDIGCGTGSLPVQIAATLPGTEVTGLDPDAKALGRGAGKAAAAGVDVCWKEGFGDALPFEEGAFDRVVSSFMFHHLDLDVKRGMLREARRVLAPGGALHLIDFGGQTAGKDGALARFLHSHESVAGNLDVELFTEAGFGDVREVSRGRFLFGRYAHVRGVA
ncbi:MAG: class I SAM-dependent methyltransferase [Deltaproteobacteria bacterium]|nr:class I SAM-dependent methyltransferase [Deltaproteobacteria bacterium]MBW2447254.1 class I SAM-dependent methyltransferase [Deltaproteobacteria bacterium]